ncbi:MAG: cysteine synthase family protein [Candidatus Stahlbacteria bacterium]|nr:cysteine synthase family protein [Candidatus Stahlbacteria bacterium]
MSKTQKYKNNILETIGNTPMVKLNSVPGKIKATILAKMEFFNPGGSIKDRIAVHILQEAEKRGDLKPGGTIVENTSGNTGIGAAIYAAIKGYKMVFTLSDKMSQRKIDLLKAFGAKVIVCPTAVPYNSPESYYEVAKRIAKETPGAFLINQYHNKNNIEAHYITTGPEIWEQTEGKVDYVVIGAGTGGTISGVGRFLKEKKPEIKIICVDPIGSIYYDYFKHKKLIEPHVYTVEGIGEDMLCEAMDFRVIDDMIQVTDKDAFLTARRLLKEEGIFAGGSSGAAVWGAMEVAKKLPKEKIIVAILPDTGYNYLNKMYNDEWMKEKGFF